MVTYREVGVDIDKGIEFVKQLRASCPDIGGFSGLYPLGDNYLAASTDGVGTKLKLALAMSCHDTVGIDLVAMCVNDIMTSGARPLFFLDYFATSELDISLGKQVLDGIFQGCQEAGCALLGGETAEMPGMYHNGDYDLAGFAVGIVSKKDLIDGREICEGDLLVGIFSNGIHSNGFSLVRKVLNDAAISLEKTFSGTQDTLGQVLLTPTRIYVQKVLSILKHLKVKGIAHITGGGILENVPRMLPKGLAAQINRKSWQVPSIFQWLQSIGSISEEEMYRTFNMGIGMVMALSPESAKSLCDKEKDCRLIGEVVVGDGVIW